MYRSKKRELIHLRKSLGELVPYVYKSVEPLTGWKHNGKTVDLPYRWESELAVFERDIEIEGENVYLKAWFGGEALLRVDGVPYSGINEYHREIRLDKLADGERHKLTVEVVPRGLFGTREEPVFSESFLMVKNSNIERVVRVVSNVLSIAEHVGDDALSRALMRISEDFLSSVNIPRDTSSYMRSVSMDPTADEIKKTWSVPNFPEFRGLDLGELEKDLMEKFDVYTKNLEMLSRRFKRFDVEVFLAGHAHIDYTWLWPMSETKRKIIRTFSTVALLSEYYDEFKFIQSSAQMYEDIEKLSPELFEKIKKLVKSGRWEPVGGMWVESDCTLPSMESLVRQFYYGQKFFESRFGRRCSVGWLPDVFGFSYILPQILKSAGMDILITTKLNWNESNEFPYDLCIWRGLDGSEVLYYSFNNPVRGYNGDISPEAVLKTVENFRQRDLTPAVFLSFGYGDGGGGPTEDMCRNYETLKDLPGMPDMKMSTLSEFKEDLLKSLEGVELPVWDGPLYLELHRGTYTSQSRTKRLHKIVEESLRTVEILNAFFGTNRQKEIDEIWKILLRNENHDLLPGSSIKEVHEEAEKEFEKISERLNEMISEILRGVSRKADVITVFNPSSFPQKLLIELDKSLHLKLGSETPMVQRTHDGKFLYMFDRIVPPLSFVEIEISGEKDIKDNSPGFSSAMENSKLRVDVREDGTLRVFSKEHSREIFEDFGNRLVLYKNVPQSWDNWDIDIRYEKSGRYVDALEVVKLEDGPIREVIRTVYETEGSEIVQHYILYRDSPRLEIETKLNWHARRTVLKALFPINALTRTARVDLDGGYMEIPTHRNTNFEKARFEIPHHRWVDLSQSDFGVAVLNDAKYGSSIKGSTLGLTLIKAGIFPDFFCDEGHHEFRYAIYPHGGCALGEIVAEADTFNKKLLTFEGKITHKPVSISLKGGSFKILSFREHDGVYVLRIVETIGSSGRLTISLKNLNFSRVYTANILEDELETLESSNGSVETDYSPFELITLVFVR